VCYDAGNFYVISVTTWEETIQHEAIFSEADNIIIVSKTCRCFYYPESHGRRKRGVCRGSDTANYLRGDIDMYIP